MKKIKYIIYTHNKHINVEKPIYLLMLDYAYFFFFMNKIGSHILIPSFEVLNEELMSGGSLTGGATWDPFSIDRIDYNKIVKKLLELDTYKHKTTYIFNKTIHLDKTLNRIEDPNKWRKEWLQKYIGKLDSNSFEINKSYLIRENKQVKFAITIVGQFSYLNKKTGKENIVWIAHLSTKEIEIENDNFQKLNFIPTINALNFINDRIWKKYERSNLYINNEWKENIAINALWIDQNRNLILMEI